MINDQTVLHVTPDFSETIPQIERTNVKEMLTVDRSGERIRVRINSSSLGIILSCPRKSFYSLHRKFRTKSESAALIFGTAIHKALEVFYSHPRADRLIPKNFIDESDLMAFGPGNVDPTSHFLYAAIRAFVEAAQPLAGLPDGDKRSIPNGIYLLQKYFMLNINDPYVVYCDGEGPVTERTFSLPLFQDAALEIELFGTIDVVLRSEQTGSILAADHKTTSQMGSDFLNRIKPNHQYTGYLLGAQQVLGLQTNEFMVNGFHVYSRPKSKSAQGPKFMRQITTRSPADIEEFRQSVIWAVRTYLGWEETAVWPIGNVNECAMYGGCSYIDICRAPSEIRQNILDANFTA